MKSNCRMHLVWAAAIVSSVVPTTQAQNELPGAAARHMEEPLGQKKAIPAGLVGQPSRKSPRRFDISLIQLAPVSKDPGLQGQLERKEAQLPGPTNPASAVVQVASRPSFVDLWDGDVVSSSPRALSNQPHDLTPNSSFDPRAFLTTPVDLATLGATQSFIWSAGVSAQDYWIWAGSCYDCTDLLDSEMGFDQSVTAYLPTDGRVIFATLFTEYAGNWYWADYQFAASNYQPQAAQMISPLNGATLSATQTFSWTPGGYVDQYYLWIGSCQDCNDILNESENLNLLRTISLPSDGRTIYVSLFSSIAGQWYWYDYQYRAAYGQLYNPTIYITNNLDYPINVFVNGNAVGSVSANNTQYANVTVSSLSVSFQLVQPTLAGTSLGDSMAGVFQTIANPSGSYTFAVGNVIGEQPYFEPLITNQTASPVEIEVNAGLAAQNQCNCEAPAGATNVSTGYYMLFSNGNVLLFPGGSNYTGNYWFWGTDTDGTVAPGGTLPNYVDAVGRAYFTLTSAL
jgi:hypothetical protein